MFCLRIYKSEKGFIKGRRVIQPFLIHAGNVSERHIPLCGAVIDWRESAVTIPQ